MLLPALIYAWINRDDPAAALLAQVAVFGQGGTAGSIVEHGDRAVRLEIGVMAALHRADTHPFEGMRFSVQYPDLVEVA